MGGWVGGRVGGCMDGRAVGHGSRGLWAGYGTAAAGPCCVPHSQALPILTCFLPPPLPYALPCALLLPALPLPPHQPIHPTNQVLGADYQEELLRLIAPEHLLAAYGGTNPAPLR